jgi:hypothetical protein
MPYHGGRLSKAYEKGRARPELAGDVADSAGGVRHVMQDAERIGEIERTVGQGNVFDGREVERYVGGIRQIGSGHRERLGADVEEVKPCDPRRHQRGPAAASASDVDAGGALRRQRLPWEDREIVGKQPRALLGGQLAIALGEHRPFPAEAGSGFLIDVARHRRPRAKAASSQATAATAAASVASETRMFDAATETSVSAASTRLTSKTRATISGTLKPLSVAR